MNQMKVIQINSVYNFGSTGRLVKEIHEDLLNNGHKSYVIYGRGNKTEHTDKKIYRIGSKFEQFNHLLLTRIWDRHGFGSYNSTQNMLELIDSISPDLIMLHNIHGYYLNIRLLFLFLAKKKIKVVWLFHDAWPLSGHSAHFDLTREGLIPIKNSSFFQKFEYPASYALNQSRRNFIEKKTLFSSIKDLTIVAPSYWLTSIIKKSYLKDRSVVTINNGIDLKEFKILDKKNSKKSQFINKKIILGVASVWTKKKGLDIFNELADKITDEYQIVLIGVREKDKKKFSNKIITLNRTENIYELVNYYNAAYVYVNPTFEDNFPTTNLEALACGTPVITFNTGGSPEALDANSGIVTNEKTSDAILFALNKMNDNQIDPRNCRKRAELFSKERMFTKYKDLFSTIVKGEACEN